MNQWLVISTVIIEGTSFVACVCCVQLVSTGFAVLTLLCLVPPTAAKRYCKVTSDCSDLGELECIKSFCEWGVCSCPQHKAAKYLGSDNLYRCVPRKYTRKYVQHSDRVYSY